MNERREEEEGRKKRKKGKDIKGGIRTQAGNWNL